MKKILVLSTALFLSCASFAQNDSTINRKKQKSASSQTMELQKTDGVMMKNGSMMTVKKGKMSGMTSDLVCKNGTTVTTKGVISRKDGSQEVLKEGECFDACGKIMIVNNSKTTSDRNMYLVPDSALQKNK